MSGALYYLFLFYFLVTLELWSVVTSDDCCCCCRFGSDVVKFLLMLSYLIVAFVWRSLKEKLILDGLPLGLRDTSNRGLFNPWLEHDLWEPCRVHTPVGPAVRTYRAHTVPPSFLVAGPLDSMQLWLRAARYPVNRTSLD